MAHACAGVLFGVTTVISHACTAHTLTRTQPHMRDIGKVERGITLVSPHESIWTPSLARCFMFAGHSGLVSW